MFYNWSWLKLQIILFVMVILLSVMKIPIESVGFHRFDAFASDNFR